MRGFRFFHGAELECFFSSLLGQVMIQAEIQTLTGPRWVSKYFQINEAAGVDEELLDEMRERILADCEVLWYVDG